MEESKSKTKPQTDEIIKNHIIYSMAAGLIPVPIADIAAVTAIQVAMVKQLASLYAVTYSENSGKALISALTGSTLARVGASAVKALPGVGTLIGNAGQAALAGISTYALGRIYREHLVEIPESIVIPSRLLVLCCKHEVGLDQAFSRAEVPFIEA